MTAGSGRDLRRASLRLATAYAGMILVLFALLGFVTFAIVQAGQNDETNTTLVAAGHVDSPADAPNGVLVATVVDGRLATSVGSPSWFPRRSLLRAAEHSDDPVVRTIVADGQTWAIRTTSGHDRITQVAVNTRENAEELRRVILALALSGLIATVVAAGAALMMARRAMRPMVTALAMQRRFVMDASHELRMPLTLLTTRTQLLRRELPSSGPAAAELSTVAAGLDEVLRDSKELTAVLEDLLMSSDPREAAPRTALDLNSIGRETVAAVAVEAEGRGVTVGWVPAAEDPIIDGSRPAITRLFTSLLSNALDHAAARVELRVLVDGRSVEVRVCDDGPGFSAGMEPRAFERFATSRGNPEPSGGERHYGLGLSLVADIAARHGGTVGVSGSGFGTGAAIHARFPRSRRR